MGEQQVEQILGMLDDGRWEAPNRLRHLSALSSVYMNQGVLSEQSAPALHRACPDAGPCWEGIDDRASTQAQTPWPGEEDGSIIWPWVGEEYRPGGICIVTWNIHHGGEWWSIAVEYAIAADQNRQLKEGRRRMEGGSMLAYRSAASAMAIQASLDGTAPAESPDPREVPGALERFAKVQSVKCSPLGDLSRPTREMCSNCPPRFLARELEVLAPGVLVSFGAEARIGLERIAGVTWTEQDRGFRRGRLNLPSGRSAEAFSLYHPSYRGWQGAQAALCASLRRRPAHG